jgi:hypothetical protein
MATVMIYVSQCAELNFLYIEQYHKMGLMHLNMRIVYSKINESTVILYCFLIPGLLCDLLIAVGSHNCLRQIEKRT